ncbi:MAG: hypothetical protein P1U36_07940 [Legionellaceae bacterium]|nr:hypothetical protein [Legionellaceae bacterium]
MIRMIILLTLVCLTACATTSSKSNSNAEEKINSSHTAHVKFVRHEGLKQKLYYPAGFYSEDNAEQAQDRTARGWWNQ